MLINKWSQFFVRRAKSSFKQVGSERRRYRPLLEILEDRLSPAVFNIGPGDVTGLAQAINTANGNGQSNTINLAPSTYALTGVDNYWYGPNGLPPIFSDLTIQGNGAVIERSPALGTQTPFRLFYVSGGLELPAGSLTIDNLVLEGGLAHGGSSDFGGGGAGMGGAIFNQGTLTLNSVTLTGNEALGGSSGVSGLGGGGGGMGQDATGDDGGGFGGSLTGGPFGGAGGSGGGSFGNGGTSGTGGGGGFRGVDSGGAGDGGAGGGLGGFGGSGSDGTGSPQYPAGVGGDGGGSGTGSGGGGIGGGGAGTGAGGGFGGGGGSGAGPGSGGAGGFGGGAGSFDPSSTGFGGGIGAPDAGGGGAGMGGGIFNMFGTLLITNCTLSQNFAQGGSSQVASGAGDTGSGLGGAMFNLDGTATVINCTLAGNMASFGVGGHESVPPAAGGGAIANVAFGGSVSGGSAPTATIVLTNSILAMSTSMSGTSGTPSPVSDLFNLRAANTDNATVVAADPNIVSMSYPGGYMINTGVIAGDPGLVLQSNGIPALQDNGGLTPTIALNADSPARNQGVVNSSVVGVTIPTVDQRGLPRPTSGSVDLGAFQHITTPAHVMVTSGSPQNASVDTTYGESLQVLVTDDDGNPVDGVPVVFTAPATNASGTFGNSEAASVLTNANGLASAPAITANPTVGTFTVTAAVNGVADPASFTLTNTAGPAADVMAAGGSGQNTVIGTTFGTALQAKVVDVAGDPVPNVPVSFAAPEIGPTGSFNALTTVLSDARGIATAPTFRANHIPGNFIVDATVAGIANPADFSLTNTTVPFAIKAVAGGNQHAAVTTAYKTNLQVRVTDAHGKPVAGITVDFELPNGTTGMFSGSPAVVTNANGVATAPTLTANSTAGTFSVSAWVAEVNTPATFTLTNRPLGPSSLSVFAGNNQVADVGKQYAQRLEVQVVDQYGNPVGGVQVTFTAPETGASGTVSGKKTVTVVTGSNGVAGITLTANQRKGTFQVVATVTNLNMSAVFDLKNVVIPEHRV